MARYRWQIASGLHFCRAQAYSASEVLFHFENSRNTPYFEQLFMLRGLRSARDAIGTLD